MYEYTEYQKSLIDKFIKNTGDKEEVLNNLSILKSVQVDPLKPCKPYKMHAMLCSHVFSVLIKYFASKPEEEYLLQIWDLLKLEDKKRLKLDCEETDFGKTFLKTFPNNKVNFVRAGKKINFNVLNEVIDKHFNKKYPQKLFNFLKENKNSVTSPEWDELMKKMLINTNNINYVNSWEPVPYRIKDIFSLVEQLNAPKKIKVENVLNICSVINERTNCQYYDSANKHLSQTEIGNRWQNAINLLDNSTMYKGDVFYYFQSIVDKDLIIANIKNSAKLLEQNDLTNTETYPLSKNYSFLFTNDNFRPVILEMLFVHSNVEVNQMMYRRYRGQSLSLEKQDVYKFFSEKLVEDFSCEENIRMIMGAVDFSSQEFKESIEIQKKVLIEKNMANIESIIPEKETKSSKVKI